MESKNMIQFTYKTDAKYDYYDINGICENADSIYWTLVPNEVKNHVYSFKYYLSVDYIWK